MEYRLTAVAPLEAAKLLLTYADGEQRLFDVSPYLDRGIFTQLRDAAYFSRVRVVSGHVEWPRGQDFSPDTLYLRSTPCSSKPVLATSA